MKENEEKRREEKRREENSSGGMRREEDGRMNFTVSPSAGFDDNSTGPIVEVGVYFPESETLPPGHRLLGVCVCVCSCVYVCSCVCNRVRMHCVCAWTHDSLL